MKKLIKYCVYIETKQEFPLSNYVHKRTDKTYVDTLSRARKIYLSHTKNEKHLEHAIIYNVRTLKKVKTHV